VNILLVDDHPIFRLGVARFLSGVPGMRVVGEADDGIRALNLASSVAWDILVLDISLPTLGGLEVLRRLRETGATGKVVVMSHYPVEPYAARAIAEGASAYVPKGSDPAGLVAAIDAAMRGLLWVDGKIERAPERGARLPHEDLTPREYQVLLSLVHGRSNTETAAELDISASTVSNHVARIKEKLNVATRAGIITYAHRAGLTE
jgi:DNA-binding NarL/FixJ family response regulator